MLRRCSGAPRKEGEQEGRKENTESFLPEEEEMGREAGGKVHPCLLPFRSPLGDTSSPGVWGKRG